MVNESATDYPHHNKAFCDNCGKKTIRTCPKCNNLIRGAHRGAIGFFKPRGYCIECGQPFPWTEEALKASIDLFIEENGLAGDQAKEFEISVRDAARETPKTPLAASRIKRALQNGSRQAAKLFYDVAKDILCEAAKKAIWPNQPPL